MEQILNATGECPMLMSKEQWEMQNRTWQKIDNIYGQQIFKNSFFKIELNSVYDNSSRYMVMVFFCLYKKETRQERSEHTC